MSLGMMVSKSILTYMLFRSTRAIAKAGCDALGELGSDEKLCRCPRCGEFEEQSEFCSVCGTKMHKLYFEYTHQTRLVDENLMFNED